MSSSSDSPRGAATSLAPSSAIQSARQSNVERGVASSSSAIYGTTDTTTSNNLAQQRATDASSRSALLHPRAGLMAATSRSSSHSDLLVTRLSNSAGSPFSQLPVGERQAAVETLLRSRAQLREDLAEAHDSSWFPVENPIHVAVREDAASAALRAGSSYYSSSPTVGVGGGGGGGGVGGSAYTASDSYLESLSAMRNPVNLKKQYGFDHEGCAHLFVTLAGRAHYIHLPSLVAKLIIAALIYAFLLLTAGDIVTPGGEIFDTVVLVVVGSVAGGFISLVLRLGVPLIGILSVSIFWANIGGYGALTSGVKSTVTGPVKALGLTMILLRGGVSLRLELLKPMKFNAAALALLPLAADIALNTLLTSAMFDYSDSRWSLLHAATLAPVSSSVIVTACLFVQARGRGNFSGPLLLLLSVVPLDSSLGIFVVTTIQGLVLSSPSSSSSSSSSSSDSTKTSNSSFDNSTTTSAWNFSSAAPPIVRHTENDIVRALWMAPAEFVGGILAGIAAAFLLNKLTSLLFHQRVFGGTAAGEQQPPVDAAFAAVEWTRFTKNQHLLSTLLIVLVAGAVMIATKEFSLEGSGSLFVVSLAVTLGHIWGSSVEGAERLRYFSRETSIWWNNLLCPALFCFVGADARAADIFDTSFLWKGLVLAFASISARCLASMISTMGSDFTTRERIVASLGIVGKASSQATLAFLVLDRATAKLDKLDPSSSEYETWKRYKGYGKNIADSSILTILVAAPVCALSVRILGSKWVREDDVSCEQDPVVSAVAECDEKALLRN